jgi:hypothetical protein
LALVLDRGDSTLLAPVNRVLRSSLEPDLVAWAGEVRLGGKVGGLELLRSHISELVDTNGVGVKALFVLSIVLVDESEVLLEDEEADVLLSIFVLLVEFKLELAEKVLFRDLGLHSRGNCD